LDVTPGIQSLKVRRISDRTTLDEEHRDDPEYFTTALEQAAYCENVEILKRLKPEPKRDDLQSLLEHAATFAHVDVVRYLSLIDYDCSNSRTSKMNTF